MCRKTFGKIFVLGFLAVFCVGATRIQADSSHFPSQNAISFAKEANDLLLAELFAALLQEFAETTPDNVEHGKLAISLVFDDSHTNFRLVGNVRPLSDNNYPRDGFEETALERALQGQAYTSVEQVSGRWFYRSSTPVSNFDPSCSLCHTNFGPVDPDFFTGGLMLKVPVSTDKGDDRDDD